MVGARGSHTVPSGEVDMTGHRIAEGSMGEPIIGTELPGEPVDRRDWLWIAAGAAVGLRGFVNSPRMAVAADDSKLAVIGEAAAEIQRAEARARKATNRPLRTL